MEAREGLDCCHGGYDPLLLLPSFFFRFYLVSVTVLHVVEGVLLLLFIFSQFAVIVALVMFVLVLIVILGALLVIQLIFLTEALVFLVKLAVDVTCATLVFRVTSLRLRVCHGLAASQVYELINVSFKLRIKHLVHAGPVGVNSGQSLDVVLVVPGDLFLDCASLGEIFHLSCK